ncbi:MAG: hypothetical protein ABL962_18780 [Fimbriimonadaceae bacterium]
MTDFEEGVIVGLLVGEGSFGGDGKQPQVTLKMHVRHEKLFFWLVERLPESKLYGPYHHGDRNFYQWMMRGKALRETLAPILAKHIQDLDEHGAKRFHEMCHNYNITTHSFVERDAE